MTGKIDAAEALLGALFVVVSTVSLAGIALAEAGILTTTTVGVAGLSAAAVVLIWMWRAIAKRGGLAPTPRRDWAMLAGTIAISILVLLPPMEAIVDSSDASVYLAIGRLVAEQHSLRPVDAAAASLTPDVGQQLFAREPWPPPVLNYFPGGVQLTDDARIEPSFFHLAPIWMAIFDLTFGPRGGLFTGLFFGVLAIPLAWAIGRRLAGAWTGAAAAALILANFGEQMFARWPCSEISAQYFSLAAVWWLTLSSDDDGSAWAAVAAGLAIGLAAFTRIDALLATALPVLAWLAVMAVMERAGRRARTIALVTGAIVTTYAVVHVWVFSHAYASRALAVMSFVQYRFPKFVWGTIAAGLGLGILYIVYERGNAWMRRAVLIGGVVLAAGVLLIGTASISHSVLDPLLTGPGIGIAFVGLVALLVRAPLVRGMPLTVVFLVPAFLYLQHRLEIAGGLLSFRRCVPVLLPLGAVLIAYAFATVARLGTTFKWIAVAGVMVFIGVFASSSRVVYAGQVMHGSYDAVAEIARALPENALTIADSATPSHLALALRYEFGRSVFLVSGQGGDAALVRVSEQAFAQHRPVRLLVPSSRDPRTLLPGQFAPLTIHALDQLSLRLTQMDPKWNGAPGRVLDVAREIEIYAIEPAAPAPLPIVINLGPRDFPFAGIGWNAVETMQGVSARWSTGAGQLIMPVVDRPPDQVTIVVIAAGTRPAGAALPAVQLSMGDVVLGSFVVNVPGFGEYPVPLSREQSAVLCRGGSLLIRSDAFVPARVSDSGDRRLLGIAVDRVEVIKTASRDVR